MPSRIDKARGSGEHTVEVLLLSLAKVLPPSLKLAVPEPLPKSPVAPLLMLRLVDMRLQLACNKHADEQCHMHNSLTAEA